MKFAKTCHLFSLAIIAISSLIFIWGVVIEPLTLTLRQSVVMLDKWPKELNGLKIVLISDLHFGNTFFSTYRAKRIIEKVKALKGDLILLLGDYVAVGSNFYYKSPSREELIKFFSSLHSKYGIYGILGNHDMWYGRSKMIEILEEAKVKVLDNKGVTLKINDSAFNLAGVADYNTAKANFIQATENLTPKLPLILMSHAPNFFRYVPKSVALIVSGDTHGGQIRIPKIGSLKSFLNKKIEFPPGLSTFWGRKIYVTSGAGSHRLPIRINCPPEIALITLKNVEE